MPKMCDLTNGEIIRIVTDIFQPKKITCITRHKREDYISCHVYTDWQSSNDDGTVDTVTCRDEIELRNPFECGRNAIYGGDIPLREQDYTLLKQFCFAHGMMPDWMRDNPYLGGSGERQDAGPVPMK